MSKLLLTELKEGNSKTIAAIYEQHYPFIENWIQKNRGQKEDAKDIFHDALLSMIIGVDEIRSDFKSLLITICKNKWRDRLRKSKLHQNYELHLIDNTSTPSLEEELIRAEEKLDEFQKMERTLRNLSELCQKVIIAVRRGVSPDELIKELKMTNVNTLYRRKHACMKRWKQLIMETKN